jgi:nitrous oxide reductase accessory protein NosL
MRRIALIPLLLLALAVAGCGASGESDDAVDTDTTQGDAAPIAASQVVQQFLEAAEGTQLQETTAQDPSWEQLGLGLNPTPAQQRQYGIFTIYVVDPERTEAVESLLSDKDTAEPLEEAAGGIHWDFDEAAQSYVANKQYGPNVVLAWWNEKPQPTTDPRWDRLDALMQKLTTG